MKWLNRFNPLRRERRAYTDTLTRLLMDRAQGSEAVASAADTAAAEIAAGLIGRAFAAGKLQGNGLVNRISPALLASLGRDLVVRGESLIVKAGGGFMRAAQWDVKGDSLNPDYWQYIAELPVPNGAQVKRTYAGSEVAHIRYSTDSAEPWKGISPLVRAGLGSKLIANIESKLGQETSGPVGSLLPLPHDESLDELKADLKKLNGGTALVESTSGGWGEGRQNAPLQDYTQKRIGANPPDSLVSLYTKSQLSIVAAAGVPVELLQGSNQNAAREGFRRFLHSTVQPLARLVEPELSKLVGSNVTLDFSGLMASDIQGRARAFGSLVQGGMEIEPAMKLTGLYE